MVEALAFLSCDPILEGPAPEQVAIRIEAGTAGLVAREDGRAILEAPGPRAVMEALHAYLFRAAIQERAEEALLHAACLVRHGRRILLVGAKGAGKTTLSLRLALAGYAIEGDENVFVRRSGVIARPRACRVKEAALPLLPAIADAVAAAPSYGGPGRRLFNLEPGRLGLSWRIAEGPVGCVIAIRPNHGGTSSLAPLAPGALLGRLMAETAWREADRAPSVAGLAGIAARAAAFELALGDLASALSCVDAAAAA